MYGNVQTQHTHTHTGSRHVPIIQCTQTHIVYPYRPTTKFVDSLLTRLLRHSSHIIISSLIAHLVKRNYQMCLHTSATHIVYCICVYRDIYGGRYSATVVALASATTAVFHVRNDTIHGARCKFIFIHFFSST